MAGYGYSRINDKGFLGLWADLSAGVWTEITVAAALIAAQPAKLALAELPARVLWKLRLTWAIQYLAQMLGVTADQILIADGNWDSAQRKLHFATALSKESQDPVIRAAAEHVRAQLLAGDGTAQTRWSLDKQIDFGRSQLLLASKEPLAGFIHKLDLNGIMIEIEATTVALAAATGRDQQAGVPAARSVKIRAALSGCAGACNAVHEALDWAIGNQGAGPERERLEALRAPLLALLARYPATGGSVPDGEDGEDGGPDEAGSEASE